MTPLEKIFESDTLPQDLMALAEYFDSLCDSLLALTEQENETFFSGDFSPAGEASARKTALLTVFEEQAEKIFEAIRDHAGHNVPLQRYFIKRLDVLQEKLRVNTSLQIHAVDQIHGQISGQEAYEQCH